jgi:hypothetical protein
MSGFFGANRLFPELAWFSGPPNRMRLRTSQAVSGCPCSNHTSNGVQQEVVNVSGSTEPELEHLNAERKHNPQQHRGRYSHAHPKNGQETNRDKQRHIPRDIQPTKTAVDLPKLLHDFSPRDKVELSRSQLPPLNVIANTPTTSATSKAQAKARHASARPPRQ